MTESNAEGKKGSGIMLPVIIFIFMGLMGSAVGLGLGQMMKDIENADRAKAGQRARIVIGTIIVTGDYQELLEMGLKSELFKLHAEQSVIDGPQFVFRVKNGQVEGWLDQRPGVALVGPPLFTLEFKPKDPANPTAEEIMAISSDILIKISKYTVILPAED